MEQPDCAKLETQALNYGVAVTTPAISAASSGSPSMLTRRRARECSEQGLHEQGILEYVAPQPTLPICDEIE